MSTTLTIHTSDHGFLAPSIFFSTGWLSLKAVFRALLANIQVEQLQILSQIVNLASACLYSHHTYMRPRLSGTIYLLLNLPIVTQGGLPSTFSQNSDRIVADFKSNCEFDMCMSIYYTHHTYLWPCTAFWHYLSSFQPIPTVWQSSEHFQSIVHPIKIRSLKFFSSTSSSVANFRTSCPSLSQFLVFRDNDMWATDLERVFFSSLTSKTSAAFYIKSGNLKDFWSTYLTAI